MKKKVLIMMVAFCVFSLQLQAQIQKKAPRWTKEILSPSPLSVHNALFFLSLLFLITALAALRILDVER